MKHCFYIIMTSLSVLLVCGACGNVNDFPDLVQDTDTTSSGGTGDIVITDSDTIVIDESPLTNEAEVVLTPETGMYKDFLENFQYDDDKHVADDGVFDAINQQWTTGVKTITITYNEDKIESIIYKNKDNEEKEIKASDFETTQNGAHLTIKGHTKCNYILKGTSTDGSFKLYTDKKCIITLSGLTLTNPNGAAINIQKGNDGGKRTFLVVKKGTNNYLSDGATYNTPDGEDEKGVIFSEGKICVSGGGYLKITGNGKNAVACDDYIYLHAGPQISLYPASGSDGIKAKDGIYIGGGVLNIICKGDSTKGLNTDSLLWINGGRTHIVKAVTPMKYGTYTHNSGDVYINGKKQ